MASRSLPAHPNLDHLKNEAKALQHAFRKGDPAAASRVAVALGARDALKLTEAQRVIAREYGFASWAKLRVHVLSARGVDDAVAEFLNAVSSQDSNAARKILHAEPRIVSASVHAAAITGDQSELRRLVAEDPARVNEKAGNPAAPPLVWLCYSPFHGESQARDDALAASAHALLELGADPNLGDDKYGIAGLYAVTGVHNVPRIARILLEAGANPNDGESVFHAAERFHTESLDLLMQFGADLNRTGDWGNTPLYFLLRYWDVARMESVRRGFHWLLDHGADPNVPCTRAQENSLHVAVRRRQDRSIIEALLAHGADTNARRGDGRTSWILARRAGTPDVAELLEKSGAGSEQPGHEDMLIEACAQGNVSRAAELASAEIIRALPIADLEMLPEHAGRGELAPVQACLAAGFPVNGVDENGATALHRACIEGNVEITLELLKHGADHTIHDPQHNATPLGWACFGADFVRRDDGDYEGCVRALLSAGASTETENDPPRHAGIARILREHQSPG